MQSSTHRITGHITLAVISHLKKKKRLKKYKKRVKKNPYVLKPTPELTSPVFFFFKQVLLWESPPPLFNILAETWCCAYHFLWRMAPATAMNSVSQHRWSYKVSLCTTAGCWVRVSFLLLPMLVKFPIMHQKAGLMGDSPWIWFKQSSKDTAVWHRIRERAKIVCCLY